VISRACAAAPNTVTRASRAQAGRSLVFLMA
jgi:hypothetical protein